MFGPAVAVTLLSIPPLLLIKYLDYKSNKLTNQLQQEVNKDQFKYMFVTHKNRLCSPHLNTRLICGTNCSYLYLKNILNLINQAQESVCVAMYHLSVDDIYHAILNAHNRGVHVRVIADLVMLTTFGNRVNKLFSKDVPAKAPKIRFGLMHHKFMLIDQKNATNAKVLYGSLNYTVNALINNWEFVLLTNSAHIVKRFSDEFEFLWDNENFAYLGTSNVEIQDASSTEV